MKRLSRWLKEGGGVYAWEYGRRLLMNLLHRNHHVDLSGEMRHELQADRMEKNPKNDLLMCILEKQLLPQSPEQDPRPLRRLDQLRRDLLAQRHYQCLLLELRTEDLLRDLQDPVEDRRVAVE